jgi:hypothetical protein
MINLKDAITSSGSYPNRATHPELTPDVVANLEVLLIHVNALLSGLGITKAKVSSGFRPSKVNAATKGAAKKSNHMLGNAIDILDDKKQTLANRLTPEILAKYNLYMEDKSATIGKMTNWVHLQIVPPKSKKRIFFP